MNSNQNETPPMHMKTFAFLFTVLALTSCKKDDASAPPVAAEPAAAPAVLDGGAPKGGTASPWDASGAPVAGTTLTITPNVLDLCTEKAASANVTWDVAAANPKSLQLWVRNGKKTTLWAAVKKSSGAKETGKWLKSGTEILFVDASRKVVINSAQVTAAPCP
jgi:hypothetical protein